jgi:hypothetical protein
MSAVIPRYTDRLQNSSNFWFEISRGRFSDMITTMKFGTNEAVPNGAWAIIANLGGATYPFPQAPTTVRVKAGGDVNDVATTGSGARTIRVIGLDSNGDVAQEDIALAGASASDSTTTSFWRVYRAYVLTTGTYGGSNTGAIIVENTAGTADLLKMEALGSQTRLGIFSIPTGWTGYLLGFETHVEANKPADVRIRMRSDFKTVAGDMTPIREIFYEGGVDGEAQNIFEGIPLAVIPQNSDIWIEAKGGGVQTKVSAAMIILCVKDEDVTITTDS